MRSLGSLLDLLHRLPRWKLSGVEIGHSGGTGFVATNRVSPSDLGYRFEFALVEKILARLHGFSTVTCHDVAGNIITLENFKKRGRDGGLDLVIRIEAKTPQASSQVAGRIKKILSEI